MRHIYICNMLARNKVYLFCMGYLYYIEFKVIGVNDHFYSTFETIENFKTLIQQGRGN